MSWRKSVFSCLSWAVYTIMAGTVLAGIGNIFCSDMHLPSYCGAVFAAVLAAALGGTAFLLRRFAKKLTVYNQERRRGRLAAEAVIVVILFALGILFRAAGFQDAEEVSAYYDMAEVAMERNMPETAHGAVRVYVWTLHLVFIFLGNHFVLGIIAQMIFQGIAALSLYFLIRKYIGVIAALTVTGFFACAPYMVQSGLILSPDVMYLCLLAASGAAAAACCDRRCEDGAAGRKSGPFFLILAGIISAVMAYLDVAGVLVLLFSAAMIFRVDRELQGLDKKILSALCCVLGFVLGFMCCAAVDSLAGGKSFGSVLQAWFQMYRPEDFRLTVTAGMRDSRVESLILIGVMTIGIYSFWFDRKRERLTVYMAASCAVILAGCFGIFTPEMPGTLLLYLLFVLMAGIGLQQCFGCKEALFLQNMRAEADVRKAAEALEAGAAQAETAVRETVTAGSLNESQRGQEASENRASPEKQEARKNYEKQISQERQTMLEQPKKDPDALAGQETEEKKEIRYLENPLPLPKKHEKKVLDYDYPVADDDDFDI